MNSVSAQSPQTPMSKQSPSTPSELSEYSHAQKFNKVLERLGCTNAYKVANSLQGSIWRAQTKNNTNENVVIKITDRDLHKKSKAMIQGHSYDVMEDVVAESSILKYVTERKECPKSIVRFKQFLKSQTSFYFVMEDGGSSLFTFIKKAHQLLRTKQIDFAHWHKVVHVIFAQMVEAIAYIHSLNIAHFDISLENWLINDVKVDVQSNGKTQQMKFVLDTIQVKLCDFGLAQMFTNAKCLSNKYCGKEPYKSPEVINKNECFDAKSNDVWCLTICLFMICIGGPPWNAALTSDGNFVYAMKNNIFSLLTQWKVAQFVAPEWIHLFNAVFQCEKSRLNIFQMR